MRGEFQNIVVTRLGSTCDGTYEDQDDCDTQSAIATCYHSVITKFMMVMLNQFRKDLLRGFAVEKAMAHRKQIQVKKSKRPAAGTVTFKSIREDDTQGKTMSHSLLKGLLMAKKDAKDVLLHFLKPQLIVLAKAYNLTISSKEAKLTLMEKKLKKRSFRRPRF